MFDFFRVIFLISGLVLFFYRDGYAQICDRTAQIQEAIKKAIGKQKKTDGLRYLSCLEIKNKELSKIKELDLVDKKISKLVPGILKDWRL